MLEQEFYDLLVIDNEVQAQSGRSFIYYNNIIHNRIEALIDIFPAITACLSEEYVRHIAQGFVKKFAPMDGNLNLYGREFGSYLASLSECQPYPYLKDLADFEYAIRNLLYCKDEASLSPSEFSEVVQNNQSPKLSSATLGFNCEYNVAAIADYALGRRGDMPDIQADAYYFFIYRDLETANIFIKPLITSQFEMIPMLSSIGVASLEARLLEDVALNEFIQFLLVNHLWTLRGDTQ